jgi:hypothetical protein
MRMREVLVESADSGDLATALEFLRHRAHNKRLKSQPTVDSVINLVHNMGGNEAFGEKDLKYLVANDPTIQSLVKNIDEKGVVNLQLFGDEIDAGEEAVSPATDSASKAKDPQKTVAAMAKKAAAKREG